MIDGTAGSKEIKLAVASDMSSDSESSSPEVVKTDPSKVDRRVVVGGTPWPIPVRLIASFRITEDRGVGDTLARVFNRLPGFGGMGAGDAFKELMNRIGRPCHCGDRQHRLNRMFPYPRSAEQKRVK